jgi:hypothetical protein
MLPARTLQAQILLGPGVLTIIASAGPSLKAQTAPPVAERRDVVGTFFGQTVVDPYRWLEDWHEATVEQWLRPTLTRKAMAPRLAASAAISSTLARVSPSSIMS